MAGRFTVTAKTRVGLASRTYLLAISALAVARAWAEEGYQNIRVTDPEGTSLDVDSFHMRYVMPVLWQ